MSRRVRVELGERAYDIVIGRDLEMVAGLDSLQGQRGLIVSDSNVDPLYGEKVESAFTAAGCGMTRVVVPAGEPSKSAERLIELWAAAVDAELDRHGFVVALGGGVIGDLAGFLAASYLRGVRFVQLPTSLLAMVDSSVGGKTGINLPHGKNLVGAFYQPQGVVADLGMLSTLADREYVSGLAEVVKYGVISDPTLFEFLETNAAGILNRDDALVAEVVARSCEIKASVVAADEREGGLRAILNFGHTMGHALEQCDGYGVWLHGEAIAIGMVYAAEVSVAAHGLSREAADRLIALLKALNLPVRRGTFEGVELQKDSLDWATLREVMSSDKKASGRVPRLVLVSAIGTVAFGCEVPEAILEAAWASCCG